jgi:serine/threonine protein kinase
MKVVQLDDRHLQHELYFLQQLRHPNIVELRHHFITGGLLHMVFPWVPCSIATLLEQCPLRANTRDSRVIPVPSTNIHNSGVVLTNFANEKKGKLLTRVLLKLILYQIVRGVAYLH